MSNPTKKLAAHQQQGATVRVYMDISTEQNAFLEAIAKSSGRTKKGQLEFLINELKKEFDMQEAESNKRDKKKGKK